MMYICHLPTLKGLSVFLFRFPTTRFSPTLNMKPSALFSAVCFAVLAGVQAQSYKDTLIANVKKAHDETESLDDVADDVDSNNAMSSGPVSSMSSWVK
jgi:hypothetical protein